MKRPSLAIAAAAASLLMSVLVLPGAAKADVPPSSMADIYAALQIQSLVPASGSTQFVSGDQFYFNFDFVNTSAIDLVVPLNTDYGSPSHLVGIAQTWVERLGPDPTIPSLSYAGRNGNRYATGGSIAGIDATFPDGTIPAGAGVPWYTALDTTGFPPGQYRYYIEYKQLFSDGGSVLQTATIDISNIHDAPPTLVVPSGITVDATSANGAIVSYTVSATDDFDPNPVVVCSLPSGSEFAIGPTIVTCIAADSSGNTATASFLVHVNGAGEQLANLSATVDGFNLGKLGASLDDKLVTVEHFLAANKPQQACENLASFYSQVQSQSGKGLTVSQASDLAGSASQIMNVIGC
jgi:HYR domain